MLGTLALGLLVLAALTAVGQAKAALAIDLGLVIGAANGPMIRQTSALGAGFMALSWMRLLLLSALGVGLGLALSPTRAWLVMAGIAAAQIVMAGAGAWNLLRS